MLNIRQLSTDRSKDWLSLPDTRVTVFRGVGKRSYLEDCLPLASAFTVKNITLQTVKAALVPANAVIAEYNKHVIECEQKEEDVEFDWKSCLERNYVKFQFEAQRMITVSIIKKFLEELSISVLSPQLADKMTKNISKSLTRKWTKFGRTVASQKILFTALWGNILSYSSICIYDIGYKYFESALHFVSEWRKKTFQEALCSVNLQELFKFTGKKIIFFSTCWASSSFGFSFGSFCNEKYGGMVGSLMFELAAAMVCSNALVI
jgi:hypothetical protein